MLASQSFFAELTVSDYANLVAPIAVPIPYRLMLNARVVSATGICCCLRAVAPTAVPILYHLVYLCAGLKYPPPWFVAEVLTFQSNEYSQSNVDTTAKVMQITE